VDRRQILSAGWSIGAAVATDLAAHRPVMGLATFSGFSSSYQQMRIRWLPTSLLIRAQFDNQAKFAALRSPSSSPTAATTKLSPFTYATAWPQPEVRWSPWRSTLVMQIYSKKAASK
jgi:pimeloyl-ACP methyl ester carboxylesterase